MKIKCMKHFKFGQDLFNRNLSGFSFTILAIQIQGTLINGKFLKIDKRGRGFLVDGRGEGVKFEYEIALS